jgi:hypothetical protein
VTARSRSRPFGDRVGPIAALATVLDRPSAPAAAPAPRRALTAEVAHDPGRVLRDYVLAPYPPRAEVADGLAAHNLLYESFAVAEVEAVGVAVVERLRAQLGPGNLVWGIKHADGALTWELYVYDPGQGRPEAALPTVAAAVADHLRLPPRPARLPPHHLWSLELDAAGLAAGVARRLTVYIQGDHGPGASRSYTVSDGSLELANLYTFHDPRREPDAIRARLTASVHLGAPARGLAAVVAPGLFACRRLCVANKRRADGLYFAGVDTDETVRFAVEHGWPAPLVAYLDTRRRRLAHLGWDLGLDFTAGDGSRPSLEPTITRTAIHASC